MIKINVMYAFLNRLREKGWEDIPLTGYNNIDVKALRRGGKNIICIEYIEVDAAGDIKHQIDVFFKGLAEIIEKFDTKEIYLPGGGDFQIPDFFTDFCHENEIIKSIVTYK